MHDCVCCCWRVLTVVCCLMVYVVVVVCVVRRVCVVCVSVSDCIVVVAMMVVDVTVVNVIGTYCAELIITCVLVMCDVDVVVDDVVGA